MAKWKWIKMDFTEMLKKHPKMAKYAYILKDEKGFARGQVIYFPSTKEYKVYRPSEVWGSWADVLIGKYKYLSDAKRKLEAYYGKRITPARNPRKERENDYGIKGDWRPFEGM